MRLDVVAACAHTAGRIPIENVLVGGGVVAEGAAAGGAVSRRKESDDRTVRRGTCARGIEDRPQQGQRSQVVDEAPIGILQLPFDGDGPAQIAGERWSRQIPGQPKRIQEADKAVEDVVAVRDRESVSRSVGAGDRSEERRVGKECRL